MRSSLGGRRRPVVAASAAGLVLLAGLGLHLATPRTNGVQGDWSARALDGTVVAERALVSGANAALDLLTGKTVTLGSVSGGKPFVADDRLIIASPGRIDSARLDATTRWTWRSPAGTTATPLAAARGSTLVQVCPAAGTCHLVGLNAQGRQDWQSDGVARRDATSGAAATRGSLPRVDAVAVQGGGVVLTDPVSGRSTLQPGRSFLAIADGPVVTELVQGGRCVVAAYATADAVWTRVLPSCPAAQQPTLAADLRSATLTWPTKVERLALATGRTLPPGKADKAGDGATADGKVIARAPGLAARESRKTLHTNPFRWGEAVTIIQVEDDVTGNVHATVVSDRPLALLRLDEGSMVVRDGGQVVRYTLDHRA